jgi:hypothetical protein
MATKKRKARKAQRKTPVFVPEPFPLPEPACEVADDEVQSPKPEIAVVKIEAPEPDERLVVLKLKGHPEHLPEPMQPELPIEIEKTPLKKSFWQWLGSLG